MWCKRVRESQISARFIIRPTVLELQAIFRQVHWACWVTANNIEHYTLKYTPYVLHVFLDTKFRSAFTQWPTVSKLQTDLIQMQRIDFDHQKGQKVPRIQFTDTSSPKFGPSCSTVSPFRDIWHFALTSFDGRFREKKNVEDEIRIFYDSSTAGKPSRDLKKKIKI